MDPRMNTEWESRKEYGIGIQTRHQGMNIGRYEKDGKYEKDGRIQEVWEV